MASSKGGNLVVSVSVVVTLLATISGGAAWLTSVHDTSNAALAKTNSLEEKLDKIDEQQLYYRSRLFDSINRADGKIDKVDTRLSRIEGKLDVVLKGEK
jgi:hypothetical protein